MKPSRRGNETERNSPMARGNREIKGRTADGRNNAGIDDFRRSSMNIRAKRGEKHDRTEKVEIELRRGTERRLEIAGRILEEK